MVKGDYVRVMEVLKSAYPAIKWSPQQHDWLWNKVKNELCSDLADAVDNMIGWRVNPPPPNAVLKAVVELSIKNRKQQQPTNSAELKSLSWCELCGLDGAVSARHVGNGLSYAFRCPCPAGAIHGFNYPLWSDERTSLYEPDLHPQSEELGSDATQQALQILVAKTTAVC